MDPVSGTSLPLLTFVLTHGLEVKHFLSNASRFMLTEIQMDNILNDQGSVKTVLTGSAPEGLSLEHFSDIDIMTVLKVPIYISCKRNVPVMCMWQAGDAFRKECEASNTLACRDSHRVYLNIEDSEWHGYKYVQTCKSRENTQGSSDQYVNGNTCIEAHLKDIDQYWEHKNIQADLDEDPNDIMQYRPQKRFSRHGPSGTTYAIFDEDIWADTDNVVALQYPSNPDKQKHPGWPNSAIEWVDRKRSSSWPSEHVIKEIITSPVYLVPKGHPLSKNKDLEWRISFSYAEVVLSRSFNQVQRYCLLIYKLIYYSLLKPRFKENISTYHFKTTMYWLSEKHTPNKWQMENLGELFLLLTDEYITFLKNRNLPMYFIPKNNLITHLTHDLIEEVLGTMLALRKNPIQYIMHHLRLPGHRQLPRDTFIQIYNEHIGNDVDDLKDNANCLHSVFASMLAILGKNEFDDGDCKVSLSIFMDALHEHNLVNEIPSKTILSYLLMASHLDGSLHDSLVYAEQLRSLLLSQPLDQRSDEEWKYNYLEVTLRYARLLSVMSFTNDSQKEELINQAEGLYQNMLEVAPQDMAVNTEFAQYLMIKGQIKEAVSYLEATLNPLIDLSDDPDNRHTKSSANSHNGETVNKQQVIELLKMKTVYATCDEPVILGDLHCLISPTTNSMQIPTVILAYHLIIESYKTLMLTDKIQTLYQLQEILTSGIFESGEFQMTGLSVLDICKEKVTGEKVPCDLQFIPYSQKTVCQHLLAWAQDMRQTLHQIRFENAFKAIGVNVVG